MGEEGVGHVERQRKRPRDRILAVGLHGEISRNIEQADHVAHRAAADLVDAAVVRAVFAAVRIEEHMVQIRVGGVDADPVDLIDLRGEEGHELLQSVEIVVDHLAHAQIVIHIRIMIDLHKFKGQITGDPAALAADDHIGHIEDAVRIHIMMDGRAVGARGIRAVIVQDLLTVGCLGIG